MSKNNQEGFSIPEMLVVLLILAILAVLALPQLTSWQRMFRYSGMQRQFVSSIRNARQEAMSQRTPITFRYDNPNAKTIIYGGSYGVLGNQANIVTEMSGIGLESADIKYGIPTGLPTGNLGDGTSLTSLATNAVEVTFQADGSVVDGANNPSDTAMFFYHNRYQQDTSFAVSILGSGGRVKIWRYNQQTNAYIE